MGAHVPGADVRIVVDHVDVVYGDPEDFRDDLGNDRLRALPDVGGAREDIHLPVVIDLDDRAAAVRLVDPGAAAHVHEGGHAEAPAVLLVPFSAPAEPALHLFHALLHAAAS